LTDDGPVYHALSDRLSRAKLVARFDDRYVKAEFAKSGVWDKVPEGSALIFVKRKCSPYSIAERKVLELIPVLGSQPACDRSHKPGGRLPLLSARPAVTLATLKRAAASFAAG